ncbi:MAG: hypothetical protein ACK5Y0_04915, partial [Pseudomonadota bacterium]
GLANVRARLALVYDREADLQLSAAVRRGTGATLRLPRTGPPARPASVEVVVLVEEKRRQPVEGPVADVPPAAPGAPTTPPAGPRPS